MRNGVAVGLPASCTCCSRLMAESPYIRLPFGNGSGLGYLPRVGPVMLAI